MSATSDYVLKRAAKISDRYARDLTASMFALHRTIGDDGTDPWGPGVCLGCGDPTPCRTQQLVETALRLAEEGR